MLDPIARLPLEISSEIFLQCISFRAQPTGIRSIPTILLQVCHAWTDIALSITALWTQIRIILPCSRGFPFVLDGWIKRAREQPLRLHVSIRFGREEAFDDGVSAALQRHSGLLQDLEIELEEEASMSNMPWQGTETGSMPHLQNLRIHSRSNSVCAPSTIQQLLRCSPNLVNLYLYSLNMWESTDGERAAIVLPRLHRLDFGRNDWEPDSEGDEIFAMITTPGLESLHLLSMHTLSEDLLSFLKRSSPPLRELAFDCLQMAGSTELLDDIFSVIPTLVHLDIGFPDSALLERLSTILTRRHPSRALPNLQALEFQYFAGDDISDSSWDHLLPVLVARRAELGAMRIYVHGASNLDGGPAVAVLSDFASPRVLPALKELAAGGMEFWIGPSWEENLFSA
ncbi:hypothetical protein FB45DRAFT_1093186 [Roridomyces roridus]|uniref:F-box domain-containing protein n=1 Tax=Roridomyces roridus TaxID=1738132 RepID=A0AAD7FIY8_9AGAR|nr:hypothetical protein FB45DRAFT_1093186 [Roridomyces roridus]